MFKTGSVQTRRTLLREPLPHGRQVSEVWTGDSHPASDDHRDGLPGVPVEAGSSEAASPHTHWGAPTSHEVGAEDLTDLHKKMSQPTAASNLTFNPLLVAPIESSSSRVHSQEVCGHVQHRDLLRIVKPEWYSQPSADTIKPDRHQRAGHLQPWQDLLARVFPRNERMGKHQLKLNEARITHMTEILRVVKHNPLQYSLRRCNLLTLLGEIYIIDVWLRYAGDLRDIEATELQYASEVARERFFDALRPLSDAYYDLLIVLLYQSEHTATTQLGHAINHLDMLLLGFPLAEASRELLFKFEMDSHDTPLSFCDDLIMAAHLTQRLDEGDVVAHLRYALEKSGLIRLVEVLTALFLSSQSLSFHSIRRAFLQHPWGVLTVGELRSLPEFRRADSLITSNPAPPAEPSAMPRPAPACAEPSSAPASAEPSSAPARAVPSSESPAATHQPSPTPASANRSSPREGRRERQRARLASADTELTEPTQP